MLRKEKRNLYAGLHGSTPGGCTRPAEPENFEGMRMRVPEGARYSEPREPRSQNRDLGPQGLWHSYSDLTSARRERAFFRVKQLVRRRSKKPRKSATTGFRWVSPGRYKRPSPIRPNKCRCCLG